MHLDIDFHTDSQFSYGYIYNNKNKIDGRPVRYSELRDIGAYYLSDNTNLNDEHIMYHHFYGFRGFDHRILPPNLFKEYNCLDEELLELGINRYRLDLTVYNNKILPNGELNRSKGHTNKQSVELMQCLFGKVRIYLENGDNSNSTGYYCDLRRNDIVVIPPGWYHSTYSFGKISAVLDLVNKEGFTDWKDKGYSVKQASCTFAVRNRRVVPIINPSKSIETFVLKEFRPKRYVPCTPRFRMLTDVMYNLNDIQLLQFSKDIVNQQFIVKPGYNTQWEKFFKQEVKVA